MCARKNIQGQVCGMLKPLEYVYTKNTHAYWKCFCKRCCKITIVSYSNLKSGNSKSCSSCCKKIPEYTEQKVIKMLKEKIKIVKIANTLGISRSAVYRIKKEISCDS